MTNIDFKSRQQHELTLCHIWTVSSWQELAAGDRVARYEDDARLGTHLHEHPEGQRCCILRAIFQRAAWNIPDWR